MYCCSNWTKSAVFHSLENARWNLPMCTLNIYMKLSFLGVFIFFWRGLSFSVCYTKDLPFEMIDKRLAFPALRRGCFQTKGHSAKIHLRSHFCWVPTPSSATSTDIRVTGGMRQSKKQSFLRLPGGFFFSFSFFSFFLGPYGMRATGACPGFHVAPRYQGGKA